jgi:hypothetical protein
MFSPPTEALFGSAKWFANPLLEGGRFAEPLSAASPQFAAPMVTALQPPPYQQTRTTAAKVLRAVD